SLPHGVQFQNRELPRTTRRRPQIHTQDLHSHLPPHFLQQPAVPTPDVENSPCRPITPQRPQNRRMVTQQTVRLGKSAVRPLQHLGRQSADIQNLFLKGTLHPLRIMTFRRSADAGCPCCGRRSSRRDGRICRHAGGRWGADLRKIRLPEAQGLRRIPFACHPPSPPPRRLRGGFPSTPPGRPECDATPLWHACHPPSAARTRLRPQSLRTRPSPPRTRRKRWGASGSRALVHRRPGSCSYPRRRPQVHRSSWRPSFRVQGPLQRPRQRQRGTLLLSKLLRRNQRHRKRRHQRLRSRSGAKPPFLRLSPRRSPPSLRPALRAPAPPHSHHELARHRPPRLFRAAYPTGRRGYWHARRLTFLMGGTYLKLEWLRMVGDVVFF